MVIYILKFSACLLLFIGFYKVFLERESFHKLKRYYLLGALVIAIVIPFVTFTTYIEAPVSDTTLEIANAALTNAETLQVTNWKENLPILLWSLYAIGFILFGFRFIKHLNQLYIKIKINQKLRVQNFTNVLLKDKISPHTFFKYIFLNKYEFEKQLIPKEVILHEQTHAKQLHAIDILCVEIIHIVFWFNPLIYLIKKDIKLNHEFLADQSVLNGGIKPSVYQELLLAFSSNAAESSLANAINYSLIKKRFTVMKSQTSKATTWLKSMALIPLIAFMLYGFSSKKEVITSPENHNIESSDYTARSIIIDVLDNDTYLIDGLKATKNSMVTVVNKLHQDITPAVRNKIMNIHVNSSNEISNKEIWFIFNSLKEYGFHRLVTPNQEVVKSKGNTPFKEETLIPVINDLNENSEVKGTLAATELTQKGASRDQMKEYNELAKYYNSMSRENMKVQEKDVERMNYIYSLMSKKQRNDAEPYPDLPNPPPPPDAPVVPKIAEEVNAVLPPPPPPIPDNATPEERKKYEHAIKEYKVKAAKVEKQLYKEKQKALKEEKEAYKLKEGKKKEKEKSKQLKEKQMAEKAAILEVEKTRASETQKRSEAQKAELAEVRVKREKERAALIVERKTNEKERRIEVERRQEMRDKEMKRRKAELDKNNQVPRSPRNPLDLVIDMAKKGADFYLEGNSISSDMAIETIKSNKKVNIETLNADSDQPKVYISTGPPVIKD